MIRFYSFRFRILALVVGVAVVPLVLIGLVLIRGAAQSGESLLVERLDHAAAETREALVQSWIPVRSLLLDVSEWPEVLAVLSDGDATRLTARLLELNPGIRTVRIESGQGDTVYRLDRSSLSPDEGGVPPSTRPLLRVEYPIQRIDMASASIEYGLDAELLLSRDAQPASAAGMVLALLDPETGASLLPIPLDPSLLTEARFSWGGEEWLAERRSFEDPNLILVVSASLTPYVAPFRKSARNGALLLAAVALCALLAAVVLTTRMTRSLRDLVSGADAVTAGDLSRRISHREDDEIGRVAVAFNNMTSSLQRTLREQASRESLAAMGEFAASLAHEVRNPLTAVKLDLQHLEEKIGDEDALRGPLLRSLREIDRLDATVGDALSVVRRADGDRRLDVWRPIESAIYASRPEFERREVEVELNGRESEFTVFGDTAALEQLFLNLLLNAAEASPPGARTSITVSSKADSIAIRVEDEGPGISPNARERIFEPLFSTKESGTGLGLTIARRIVEAHRGELDLREGRRGGTVVEVRFPAATGAAEADPSPL